MKVNAFSGNFALSFPSLSFPPLPRGYAALEWSPVMKKRACSMKSCFFDSDMSWDCPRWPFVHQEDGAFEQQAPTQGHLPSRRETATHYPELADSQLAGTTPTIVTVEVRYCVTQASWRCPIPQCTAATDAEGAEGKIRTALNKTKRHHRNRMHPDWTAKAHVDSSNRVKKLALMLQLVGTPLSENCQLHCIFIAVARTVANNDGNGLQTLWFGLVELCL